MGTRSRFALNLAESRLARLIFRINDQARRDETQNLRKMRDETETQKSKIAICNFQNK